MYKGKRKRSKYERIRGNKKEMEGKTLKCTEIGGIRIKAKNGTNTVFTEAVRRIVHLR